MGDEKTPTICCYAFAGDDGRYRPAIQICGVSSDDERFVLPGSYETEEEAIDAADRATTEALRSCLS